MYWKPNSPLIIGLMTASIPIISQAKIYQSVEQAQKILIPNKVLIKNPIIISNDLQDRMRSASSIRHPFQGDRI
jgi:hypothetical protein